MPVALLHSLGLGLALLMTYFSYLVHYAVHVPVSRDMVSPHKTIRRMNKSTPRMESTGIECIPLKTKIRYKTQNVNAKHLRCQCIVSGRSCEPSP